MSIIRALVEKRHVIFEVPVEELNDSYVALWEKYPEVHDALLRRRSMLAGQE